MVILANNFHNFYVQLNILQFYLIFWAYKFTYMNPNKCLNMDILIISDNPECVNSLLSYSNLPLLY